MDAIIFVFCAVAGNHKRFQLTLLNSYRNQFWENFKQLASINSTILFSDKFQITHNGDYSLYLTLILTTILRVIFFLLFAFRRFVVMSVRDRALEFTPPRNRISFCVLNVEYFVRLRLIDFFFFLSFFVLYKMYMYMLYIRQHESQEREKTSHQLK